MDVETLGTLSLLGGIAVSAFVYLAREPSRQAAWRAAVAPRHAPLPPRNYDGEIQTIMERLIVSLMVEYPGADAFQIATFARDTLLNERIHDPRFVFWATEGTVLRLARTAARRALRVQGSRREILEEMTQLHRV